LSNGETVAARLVIWATGRRRGFLGGVGARARAYDRLAGYVRYVAAEAGGDPRTLLEAAPDGWWYAAASPSGTRAIAFMTDADLGRRLGLMEPDRWRALRARTRLIEPMAADLSPEQPIVVRTAHSSLIDPVCGPDWIAAGDAASCFEPLASQGIARALRSGCFAAYAGFDILSGRGEAARVRYATLIQREFAEYRASLLTHYAAERRWPDRAFWARRRVAEIRKGQDDDRQAWRNDRRRT
jgi:flavin-dependent dehydrogenase